LITAVGIVAAACGGGAASAPPPSAPPTPAPGEPPPATPAAELEGKITFLHKYSDPRYAPYFEQVVAAYMVENPKVEIEIQAESDQGVKDKLRILAATNKLPDVYFSWAGDFTKKFVRGDLAKDLTGDVTG
jgi:raffinose/stachyose/melibiose transport system substrate-binding protein